MYVLVYKLLFRTILYSLPQLHVIVMEILVLISIILLHVFFNIFSSSTRIDLNLNNGIRRKEFFHTASTAKMMNQSETRSV